MQVKTEAQKRMKDYLYNNDFTKLNAGITLTSCYDSYCATTLEAQFGEFMKRLNRKCKAYAYDKDKAALQCFAVLEKHNDGQWHIHGMIEVPEVVTNQKINRVIETERTYKGVLKTKYIYKDFETLMFCLWRSVIKGNRKTRVECEVLRDDEWGDYTTKKLGTSKAIFSKHTCMGNNVGQQTTN